MNEVIEQAVIIHQTIAEEMMGKGVYVMQCSACDYRVGLTPEMAARYMREGWPVHCGQTVVVERVGEIHYEQTDMERVE